MPITNAGAQAIISSEAGNYSIKINITGFVLGASNAAFNAADTVIPGGVVFTGDSTMMKSFSTNANTVVYEIVLPETVGGFSYGSAGLLTDTGVLFSYSPLPSIRTKTIRDLPAENGDVHRIFRVVAFTNASSALNTSIVMGTSTNLPSVNLITDLPAANISPYSIYIVLSVSSLGNKPGLAYTDGIVWAYSPLSNAFSSYAQGATITPPTATGNGSVSLGSGGASGNNSFSFGPGQVNGDRSLNLSGNATIDGTYSLNFGNGNTVGIAGNNLAVALGLTNHVQTQNGFAIGTNNKTTYANGFVTGDNGLQAFPFQRVHGGGKFSIQGDCQISDIIYRITTNTTVATKMMIGSLVDLTVPANNLIVLDGIVAAMDTVANISYTWLIKGKIQNIGGAVTHTLSATFLDTPATTATVTFTVVGTALQIFVKGAAAQNTRWIGALRMTQMGF